MKKYITLLLIMIIAIGLFHGLSHAAEMEDYCIVPPYVKRDIPPNIFILLDNSYVNGLPAYSSTSEGALIEPLTNLMSYDPTKEYTGLFKVNDWYYYDGSEFVPASNDPASPYYNSEAVFEGNLLNWATTSNYDLIMLILEGGVSTSRQTNINTLVGYNAGTWENKVFVYNGTSSYTITDPATGYTTTTSRYACEFIIDTDLTISDSATYKNAYGYECGLIFDPPVGPTSDHTYLSDATDMFDGPVYASRTGGAANLANEPVRIASSVPAVSANAEYDSVTAGPSHEVESGGSLLSRTFNLINRMISSGAETADAAPALNLNVPKSNGNLPDAKLFYDYLGASNYACAATGGLGFYKWSATGLPTGMSIDPDTGYIDGTPADTPGTYTLSVTVTDYTSASYTTVNATDTVTNVSLVLTGELVSITSPMSIGCPTCTVNLTDAYNNKPYTGYKASATGGSGTYTWSATGMPAGMSIDSATGIISGTPSVSISGDYTYYYPVITVDDGFSTATTVVNVVRLKIFSEGGVGLHVMRPAASWPYPDLPDGKKGLPYVGYTPVAQGGTPPYTWTVWGLPPGMSYDPVTGKIFGTPGGAGNTSYTVGFRVTDSLGATDTNYGYLYEHRTGTDVQITWPYDYYYLYYSVQNQPYTNRFTPVAKGGTGIYNWSATNLPTGLSIDPATGRIYGTPTGAMGSYPITISVSDGTTADSVYVYHYLTSSRDYIYFISVPSSMPPARAGIDYDGFSLGAYGGYGQYTYTITGLPVGMTYDSYTGVVTGTPSVAGNYSVTFTVSSTNPVTLTTVSYSRTIDFQVLAPGAPVITSPANDQYYFEYNGLHIEGILPEARGGTGAYTWTVNKLPSGLTYDPSNGYISGTPKVPSSGYYYIDIIVDDGVYTSSITVRMYVSAVSINWPGSYWLPTATEGSAYEGYSFSAESGTGSLTWSASGLPSGMTLDPNTGFLSGSPATGSAGTYYFSVKVTDSSGATYTRYLGIEVAAPGFAIIQKSFNIRVCAGTAAENCDNAPGGKVLKEGLLQLYFREPPEDDLAHFGMIDFRSPAIPTVEECIGIDVDTDAETVVGNTNESSFHTAVENAVPTVSSNNLVDGVYEAVRAYMGDPYQSQSGNCDPFKDSGGDVDIQACRRNFLLILTDGEGAAQGSLVFGTSDTRFDRSELPEKCQGATSDMAKNACFGFRNDLRSDMLGVLIDGSPIEGSQNMSTYVVHADPDLTNGDILAEVASYSGGVYYEVTDPSTLRDTLSEALKDIIKRAASGTAASVLASAEGQGANLMQAVYYPRKRFIDSAAGKETEIAWIGRLANYWYWVDPFFTASNMREETVKDQVLDLKGDKIARLYFDAIEEQVKAERYNDVNGDGYADVRITPDVDFEQLGSLWEAGLKLWQRDLATNPRTIYVNLEGTGAGGATYGDSNMYLLDQSLATDTTFRTLLNVTDQNSNGSTLDEAKDVIYFVHGDEDNITGTARSRKVKVDFNGDGDSADTDPLGTGSPLEDETVERVWKLGDVINSTPRQYSKFFDSGYAHRYKPLGQCTSFDFTDYYNFVLEHRIIGGGEGLAITGGNDGMLHAFRLGELVFPNDIGWPYPGQDNLKAAVLGTDLGEEIWAFIPKHALPYLQYMQRSDYCHLYFNDLTPYIIDVPIARDDLTEERPECPVGTSDYWKCTRTKDTWRTILIGGMRFGGACKNLGTECTQDLDGDGDVDDYDCVTTPIADIGYSSYYALDISDPENPVFMWEFAHPDLGYSTTSVAVTRIGIDKIDDDGNTVQDKQAIGRWYAVFGSGPTGPITSEDETYQFLGNSDQNLRFFVLDVKTGELIHTIDTEVPNAFAGNMMNTTADIDKDGQDDAIYIGYTQSTLDGTWTGGGFGRLFTYEDPDPTKWEWLPLMEDIGPVTTAEVGFIQRKTATGMGTGEAWLFFGTGRYFYERNLLPDDPVKQRHFIAVADPCMAPPDICGDMNPATCADNEVTSHTLADLIDVTDLPAGSPTPPLNGWYLRLFPGGSAIVGKDEVGNNIEVTYAPERVITDAILSPELGLVFFVSFTPYSDGCSIGGDSFIWALEDDTGGAPGSKLKGAALLQSSTGSIEQVQLTAGEESGFGFSSGQGGGGMEDVRRSNRIMGVPPVAQGFALFTTPAPSMRILHIRER